VHNVRIRAAGLMRDELKEKIRPAKTKDELYRYLM